MLCYTNIDPLGYLDANQPPAHAHMTVATPLLPTLNATHVDLMILYDLVFPFIVMYAHGQDILVFLSIKVQFILLIVFI